MTDNLREAIAQRMASQRQERPFHVDEDKERRAAQLEALRRADPAAADHPNLRTERAIVANYLHRKAQAQQTGAHQ